MLQFRNQIKTKYGVETSNLIDKFFNNEKKITKLRADIEFIKRCLAHEKLPQFSRVNLANNELRKDEKFYKKIRYNIT